MGSLIVEIVNPFQESSFFHPFLLFTHTYIYERF